MESGQARGGQVDASGTTTSKILGPALDGNGFALIKDTDNGAYDGNSTYDQAVGPMQFIPSTWAWAGRDGNGDGKKDPNNIYDAALAALPLPVPQRLEPVDRRGPAQRDPQLQQLDGLPEHGPVLAGVLPQGHPLGPGRHGHPALGPQRRQLRDQSYDFALADDSGHPVAEP